MLGVILTNWCINWLCYNCLPRMAFLSPKIIFSIKRHYSNMCLRMVIHINSSKNPICLFPCCLITIYTIFSEYYIYHFQLFFAISCIDWTVSQETLTAAKWSQFNPCCVYDFNSSAWKFYICKGHTTGWFGVVVCAIYIYGLLLHFKLCSITHVTCGNQSVHDITEFRVYIH